MANGHGGSRVGAGRKKKETEDQQQANRDLILSWTTAEDVQAVFSTALAGAKAGRPEDRKWLTPFWFGNPENVHTITGDPDSPINIAVKMVNDRSDD